MPRPLYLKPSRGKLTPKLAQQYRRAFIARGLTINAVARGVGRQSSTVSKLLAGTFQSAPLRDQIDDYLAKTPVLHEPRRRAD